MDSKGHYVQKNVKKQKNSSKITVCNLINLAYFWAGGERE